LKYKNYKAPYIDMLIKYAQQDPIVKCKKCLEALLILLREISKLEIQGYDDLRSIWIDVDRGKISDFGATKNILMRDR
jgi:hypothetical protein